MKNVYDLEKRLVSNGYNVEIVSYGSNDVSDVHGNIFPACYRDCIVVTFRVCEGAENPVSMESNFLKYIKRQKDFTIYDNPLC